MFKALKGAWTNSGGTWTYSPYLPGNEDPNSPPPGVAAVPGPPYYSSLCPGVALDTWILADGQQTVDWSKCGASSPYPEGGGSTTPSPSPLPSPTPSPTPPAPPIEGSQAGGDFFGGLGTIGIVAAIAIVGILILKR